MNVILCGHLDPAHEVHKAKDDVTACKIDFSQHSFGETEAEVTCVQCLVHSRTPVGSDIKELTPA